MRCFITDREAKVMFSLLSVILFTEGDVSQHGIAGCAFYHPIVWGMYPNMHLDRVVCGRGGVLMGGGGGRAVWTGDVDGGCAPRHPHTHTHTQRYGH